MSAIGNKRIGEVKRANNGMRMKIIAYRNSCNVTIEFEDGMIVTGKKYSEFRKGSIRHPNIKQEAFKGSREGEVSTANNGMKMKIIKYRNANSVDIEFEDGTIVKNRTYAHFKGGCIKNPNVKG